MKPPRMQLMVGLIYAARIIKRFLSDMFHPATEQAFYDEHYKLGMYECQAKFYRGCALGKSRFMLHSPFNLETTGVNALPRIVNAYAVTIQKQRAARAIERLASE